MAQGDEVSAQLGRLSNPFGHFQTAPSSASFVPALDEAEPIQIGRLPPQEKQQCLSQGLCLYCGKAGPFAADCPVKAKAHLQLGNFVTVRRHSHRTKYHSNIPITVSNKFAPLSDAPTEEPSESALVIGYSIDRNVKIEVPATMLTGSQSA